MESEEFVAHISSGVHTTVIDVVEHIASLTSDGISVWVDSISVCGMSEEVVGDVLDDFPHIDCTPHLFAVVVQKMD